MKNLLILSLILFISLHLSAQTDTILRPDWVNKIESGYNGGQQIFPIGDGKYLIYSSTFDYQQALEGVLLQLHDTSGVIIWSLVFDVFGNDYLRKVILDGNGNMYAILNTLQLPSTENASTIIKVRLSDGLLLFHQQFANFPRVNLSEFFLRGSRIHAFGALPVSQTLGYFNPIYFRLDTINGMVKFDTLFPIASGTTAGFREGAFWQDTFIVTGMIYDYSSERYTRTTTKFDKTGKVANYQVDLNTFSYGGFFPEPEIINNRGNLYTLISEKNGGNAHSTDSAFLISCLSPQFDTLWSKRIYVDTFGNLIEKQIFDLVDGEDGLFIIYNHVRKNPIFRISSSFSKWDLNTGDEKWSVLVPPMISNGTNPISKFRGGYLLALNNFWDTTRNQGLFNWQPHFSWVSHDGFNVVDFETFIDTFRFAVAVAAEIDTNEIIVSGYYTNSKNIYDNGHYAAKFTLPPNPQTNAAIEAHPINMRVALVPNPWSDAAGYLSVESPYLEAQEVMLAIYDDSGRQIGDKSSHFLFSGQNQISLKGISNLPAGVYWFTLSGTGWRYSTKGVKM